MEQGYFITGTDTNVGKTWATVALLRHFKAQGKSALGMKPVASGCFQKDGKWLNADAILLRENSSQCLEYDLINPYAFELPVSPHIAGEDRPVDLNVILSAFEVIKDKAQVMLVEGAGGWRSPLSDNSDNSDLAEMLNLPVIIVMAIKLGCINHAVLTAEAIHRKGLACAGWIAVHLDRGQLFPERVVSDLKSRLKAPFLGELPYSADADFDHLAARLRVGEWR